MKRLSFLFIFMLMFTFLACVTTEVRTGPIHTTSEIRLDDIGRHIEDDPVFAINLIYIYKEIYFPAGGPAPAELLGELVFIHPAADDVSQDLNENEEWQLLTQYERQAIEKLCEMQEIAVEQQRWEDALSLGRSIANLDIITEYTGKEADFYLADAKKKLSVGEILGAFLAAVSSHELQPLDYESSCLFLEKAVEARQRRAAAFFYAAALSSPQAAFGNIPAALSEYALGQDTVTDMVKGVATVIVDRGYRIERGYGVPDRVGGSAFFVDASGLLITNYHVIASEVDPSYRGYSRMYIRMGDATSPRIPARVIGWDKALDLALIKTEMTPEYVFSLVDRVIPRAGDTVLAIGSPVGLEKTVTSGIVSALGRRLLQIGDVYQIDAAVNSGNSGGPVVDGEGRLVGIVFAGIPQYQGLNFAVPAERLAAALPAMLKGGKVQRPWLGLTLCEDFNGAEILYIAPNTPAAQHLVNEGSIIKSINGIAITARQGSLIPAMQDAVFLSGPGELVTLETTDANGIIRKYIMMTVTRPDIPLLEAARIDSRERIAAPLFGMSLTPVRTGLFASHFRVNRVVRGSIADQAGISVDDPLSISRLRILEDDGYAVLEITVTKRRLGYLETQMNLPAYLDTTDTL